MIGYFPNPVVITTSVDEQVSVEQGVREFSRDLTETLGHAAVSFQAVVEALSPPREQDRHPLFQAMFVYQEVSPPPELGAIRLEPVVLDLGASKFDLTLFVSQGEHSLEIAVEYRTDRFDEVWMQQLLGHYATLLEHLPADLERRTGDVPMMAVEERRRLLAASQGIPLATKVEALLPHQILEQARSAPRSMAVVCGDVRQTYRELERAGGAIARKLVSGDVKPGERVALFLHRSPLMVAGLVGTHWAGAAYVPLDPAYPQTRNRAVLEDAKVAAILTTSDLCRRLPPGAWSILEIDDLATQDDNLSLPEIAPQSSAYILYTSGSTGVPKGVVVTHGNLQRSTAARLQIYDQPPKRFLLVPSIAFDSSVAGLFWTLALAGTLVVPTDEQARDPRALARLVAKEGVTTLLCVPSLYAQMLRAGADSMESPETAIVAGESCWPQLVEDHFQTLPHVRLFNEYGPTEATVWSTACELTLQNSERAVAIGRPIPGVRVDLLDELGRLVPAGIPGNASIAGPTVADGYWQRPDLTAERFVERISPEVPAGTEKLERCYRTGDRMVWTADRRLLFLGREDEQIKLRGLRIEPGEIETALLEDPSIQQVAVVARPLGAGPVVPSDGGLTRLVAFVEAGPGGISESWRQELGQRLPESMIPSRIVEVSDLPLLPNRKIDRRQLRSMAMAQESRAQESRPQALQMEEDATVPSMAEQALISLWEGLLGRSDVGLTDNFFELGGHSLLVVEMVLAMERDFELSLEANDVFQNPTVQELARCLEQRGGSQAPPYRHLFPIQPNGRKNPVVFAVPHFFSEMFATRFRGERPVYGLRGISLRPEGNLGRWRTMRELGEDLVEEIQRRFPEESVIMDGYSFGASMAMEAVRVMEERGLPVRRLYLIAPMPIDFLRWGPLRLQIDGLRQPLGELSLGQTLELYGQANHPLTLRPYRRFWRWLTTQPRRRLLYLLGKLKSRAGLPLTSRILHADVRVERFRLHSRYQPGVVQTPTVFFNPVEPETDAAATWRPYFGGSFTVHDTPDPHLGAESVEAARKVILEHLGDLEVR